MKFEKKAQISMDLIFAILFAVIFFGTVSIISDQILEINSDLTTREQLRTIGLDVAQIITSATTLKENNAQFNLSYAIPEITIIGQTNPRRCLVEIDTEQQKIKVSLEGKEEIINFNAETTGLNIPSSKKCGTTMEIHN